MAYKAKYPVIFRVDASRSVGTGHLIRCLNLASYLPDTLPFLFLLREEPHQAEILTLLRNRKITFQLLSQEPGYDQELSFLTEFLPDQGCQVFVTDLLHNSGNLKFPDRIYDYHQHLRAALPGLQVVSLEDCRIKKFSSSVAIIPFDCSVQYSKPETTAEVLSGLQYFIFPAAFKKAYQGKKIIAPLARKFLVCIGGSDPENVTLSVAAALSRLTFPAESMVICGPAMPAASIAEIEALCAAHPGMQCLLFTQDLPELLQWADMAIVGEGLIKFDAAVFGTPAILITQFDHDSEPIRRYNEMYCALYAGKAQDLSVSALSDMITQLSGDAKLRQQLSENGRKFIDFDGGQRIFEKVISPRLKNIEYEMD